MQNTLRTDAAQLTKGEIAFLIDMSHNQSNRIHVGSEHDFRAVPLFVDDQISQSIYPTLIGVASI